MDTPHNATRRMLLARRYATLAFVLATVIAIVAVIASSTNERIAANQRAWFVARLDALIPATLHDNDLYADSILVSAPEFFGTDAKMPIYRARLDHKPVAAILMVVAPDGYGGPLDLLVAVDNSGKLLGVDILHHNETQGIGDGFLPQRSTWLHDLIGHSLDNPRAKRWTIRKDGGAFDQFTGASVTPRAILKATRRALEYFDAHREQLFREQQINDRAKHH